jgi:hypothetical protein
MNDRGIDSSRLLRWWGGEIGRLFPARSRGAPPLFYLPIAVGLLWGGTFLVLRMGGLPGPAWLSIRPVPPLPSRIWDVVASAAAALGVAQAVGTLRRACWGLAAAYLWLGCLGALNWLPVASASSASWDEIAFRLVATTVDACLIVYYRNRRYWFRCGERTPTGHSRS